MTHPSDTFISTLSLMKLYMYDIEEFWKQITGLIWSSVSNYYCRTVLHIKGKEKIIKYVPATHMNAHILDARLFNVRICDLKCSTWSPWVESIFSSSTQKSQNLQCDGYALPITSPSQSRNSFFCPPTWSLCLPLALILSSIQNWMKYPMSSQVPQTRSQYWSRHNLRHYWHAVPFNKETTTVIPFSNLAGMLWLLVDRQLSLPLSFSLTACRLGKGN